MGTSLNNPSVFQNNDGVTVADGGQTVGNDKYRSAAHKIIHTLLDNSLSTGIDAGGRLIQDQYRRIGDGRPGNGQKLPLSLGELLSVSAEHGVVSA